MYRVNSLIRSPLFVALWAAALFLPFKGLKAALALFLCVLIGMPFFRIVRKNIKISEMVKPYAGLKDGIYRFLIRFRLPVSALMLCAFLFLPLVLKDYYLDVLIMSGIYIMLALGLNVVVGYAGLLNLGFAAFYAIGAYTYALLNTEFGIGFWLCLPLSASASAFAGLLLAVPALRLKGDYLAIVTLGFGEILRLVLNNWDSLTNGPNGISGIEQPFLLGLPLGDLNCYYYLVFFFVIVSMLIISRVERSRIGRAWFAIRDNEIAASSIGINTTKYKLYAFAFGAFWAGIAGVLFASKMRFVSPESFTFMESVLILSMVILGGLGNIYGAVIGALILVLLPEMLREVQIYRMLILGLGLILLMIFRPQGLLGRGRVVHSGG